MEIINADAVSKYLVILFKRTGLGFEAVAEKSGISVATIKNMYYGKSENPGILTTQRVFTVMGGSFAEMETLNQDKQEDLKEFSISSMKEMYEYQLAEQAKIHEAHVGNIRAHYEQHRNDVTANYERLLSGKDEIIEAIKKDNLTWKIGCFIGITILIGLLILEVMNPDLGWFRF